MSALGAALNTAEGRAAFATYAEDSVRQRMRKRWEERREETKMPPLLFLGSEPRLPSENENGPHFSADWRGRFPSKSGWTPFSLREMNVGHYY